jgi:hypothetical protein
VIDDGVEVGFRGLTKSFFGQCWTTRAQCDGFWRNYCSLNSGVRIETSAGKLIRAIWDRSTRTSHLRRFLGLVRYLDEPQLKSELERGIVGDEILLDQSNRGCAQSLLVKRTEFSYEHEVRALAEELEADSDTLPFSVDPGHFIESVMFAPKMCDGKCEAITEWLVSKAFKRNRISRSTLYSPWALTLAPTNP